MCTSPDVSDTRSVADKLSPQPSFTIQSMVCPGSLKGNKPSVKRDAVFYVKLGYFLSKREKQSMDGDLYFLPG